MKDINEKNKIVYICLGFCITMIILVSSAYMPAERFYSKSLALLLIIIATFFGGNSMGIYTLIMVIFRELSEFTIEKDLAIGRLLISISVYISLEFVINNIRKYFNRYKNHQYYKNKWYETIVDNLPVQAYIFKDGKKYFYNGKEENIGDEEDTLEKILRKKKVNNINRVIKKINLMLKNHRQRRLKITISFIEKGTKKYYKMLIIKSEEISDIFTVLLLDITKSEVYRTTSSNTVSTYKDIIYNMPNAIIMHKNSKIVYANDEAISMLKAKSLSELKGMSIMDFIGDSYKASFEKKLNYLVQGKIGKVSNVNKEIKDLNGNSIEVEVFSTNLPNNNNKTLITSFKNLTEARKLREEQHKLELKLSREIYNTEFFSNISHELKTPMTVIFSTVQVLEYKLNSGFIKDTKDFVISKRIKQIKQNIFRELRLVDNMLDLTMIEAGTYNINLQKCDIVTVIEDLTLSMVNMAEDKNIDVIFDTTTEELEIVCDEYNIERIMLNLLSNAIKYSQDNGKIEVNLDHNEDKVIISIKDKGIGISPEKRKHLFQRHKVNSNSDTLKSSGIGLSLVKSLVDLLQGDVYLNEKYTEGAEFIVKLPINRKVSQDFEKKNIANDMLVDRIKVTASQIYSK